jgi:glucose-1-phosphate adenylyltransferase
VVQGSTTIDRSVVMGANHFESLEEKESHAVALGIGRNCEIRNAIVDFNARIGDGCRLVNADGVQEAEAENWTIRGGIIVVPRDATVPPGTIV